MRLADEDRWPEQPWLILDPVRHRQVEALEAAAVPPTVHVLTPSPADWCCDSCSTPLDHTAPIMAWGTRGPSYALCRACMPVPPPEHPEAPAFRPCPCAGCSSRR